MAKKKSNKQKQILTALVANEKGEIFDLEGYGAVGMEGELLQPLSMKNTVDMPYGGELMFLPDRIPVLYNLKKNTFDRLRENPYHPGEKLFPVAAFNSPGYLITYNCAYTAGNGFSPLPLFSYGAVGWGSEGFRTAVTLVDKEKRQDLRLMPLEKVSKGVDIFRKKMPENRLRKHLENCALNYGCPAAKNFFIGRFEAPLPTSEHCNARCLGCISLQKTDTLSNCQDRISFTPTPEEISEIALEHIGRVKKSVVSFGQGCEGDPLMAADVIEPAIRKIRENRKNGTINMNTNAGRPDKLEALFEAGLDSIRVSMNSMRKEFYNAYFRPRGYSFEDVLKSIEIANRRKRFVSINYLNSPGFTDTQDELDALLKMLEKYEIHMIQWRNLNFDPVLYYETMNAVAGSGLPIGMKKMLKILRKNFPNLIHGYFNPPKETFFKNK